METHITLNANLAGISDGWALTGWSRANTHHGRLYTRTSLDEETLTIELFSRPERLPEQLVASGSAAAPGVLLLSEANGSGLSGSLWLAEASALSDGELRVFFACDADLHPLHANLSALLDAQGNFAGEPGFEHYTTRATSMLNGILRARLNELGFCERHDLLCVADSDDLKRAASHLALSELLGRIATSPDPRAALQAREHSLSFHRALAATTLEIHCLGGVIRAPLGDLRLFRG